MWIDWLLSLFPILLMVVLMVGLRWGAAKAGPAGWLAAVVVAVARFGTGVDVLALAQAKALLLSVDVLMIMWGAFLLYRATDEVGGIRAIGEALPRLTMDRGMQGLLIGWVFASFLQGVGGFGVPVAVTAPLLVGLGFPPLAAVLVPSVGHGWAVTFGSLGMSFQALMAATGYPGELLAGPTAVLLGIACLACGYGAVHAADGFAGMRRLFWAIAVVAISMSGIQLILAGVGLWNLAGLGGGIVGLLAGTLLARRFRGESVGGGGFVSSKRALLAAAAGYATLVIASLFVQLVSPVRDFLGQVKVSIAFPAMQTARGYITPATMGRQITPLSHAGTLLGFAALVLCLLSWRWGLYRRGATGRILSGTMRSVIPSSLGVVALVGMAVIMSHAGMTDVLAKGLAQAAGRLFPFVSPWIGALGSFITGSNTNSNVVFALLQQRTAEFLGISVAVILGAQTAGGAIGSAIAPTKIAVGSSTGGMAAKEGIVLRALVPYVAAIIGIIALAVPLLLKVWSP